MEALREVQVGQRSNLSRRPVKQSATQKEWEHPEHGYLSKWLDDNQILRIEDCKKKIQIN